MSTSTSFDGEVFTGVWINWSYGRIQGATLTLSRDSGALLIAFLAIFVGATGRSFWRIVRYLLHLAFSSESKLDGVYHQRQAILRNTQLALDAGVDLVYTRLAWRNRAHGLDKKLSSVALLAFLVSSVFVVSGIFSSRVTGGNASDVLLSGNHCGNMTGVFQNDTATQALVGQDYNNVGTQLASQYLAYAYRCYSRNTSLDIPAECKLYVQPSLPYTKSTTASCPFDSEMCVQTQGNLLLDSGYLDSFDYLGLNSGPRFTFRLRRHCAPIVTHNYSENVTNPSDSTDSWVQYNYGASFDGIDWRNFTHKLRPQPWHEPTDWDDLKFGNDYTITSPNQIDPISSLNKTNALLTLLFLQATEVKNYARVDDPWFSATSPKEIPAWTELTLPNNTYFVAEDVATVLGCASSMQFCNPSLPSNSRCWDRFAQNASWQSLWPNPTELKIMNGHLQYFQNMFTGTIETPEGYYTISGLPSLQTRFTLNGIIQPAVIPSNRWQTEMEYIFQTDLAAAQARVVEHASGSLSGAKEFATDCGFKVLCDRLCHSQKVRSPGYYSFSMLGICIILILGTFIVLAGIFIEPLVNLIARLPFFAGSRRLTYARLEWQCNSTFELQRLAQEGLGLGTWSHTTFSVPVTERGEKLAALDITDAKHPRLQPRREVKGEVGDGAYSKGELAKAQSHQSVAQVDDDAQYERVPFKES